MIFGLKRYLFRITTLVVDDSIDCCYFDSCYLACDAILIKIIDMVF